MDVLCLDLEGVLIPEIWIGVAERTGIEALRKTTRDVPVYDDLMRLRLGILDPHRIDFATIHSVIDTLRAIAGRAEFLDGHERDFRSPSSPTRSTSLRSR